MKLIYFVIDLSIGSEVVATRGKITNKRCFWAFAFREVIVGERKSELL